MSATDGFCFATVAEGRLRGAVRGGIRRFLGVPYAAPPVSARRFMEPQPVEPWGGERDATVAGANSPHAMGAIPKVDMRPWFMPGWVEGEDYLTLNVWRPDDARENLPVLTEGMPAGVISVRDMVRHMTQLCREAGS